MAALKHRHHSKNNILYDDVEKIKAAIANAGYDVRNKMGEIFSDSLNNVRDQSSLFRHHLGNYTTKKPLKAFSIILLAGMAIGYFIRK